MPINPAALGFTNVWYESAQRHTSTTNSAAGEIHYLDAPHFCATKLEAFASRGGGDFYHHDLEDFIGLVDERPTLIDEIAGCPPEVGAFIAQRVKELLEMPEFFESLSGHLAGDEVSQQRLPGLVAKLRRTSQLVQQTAVPSVPAPRPSQLNPNAVVVGAAGSRSK